METNAIFSSKSPPTSFAFPAYVRNIVCFRPVSVGYPIVAMEFLLVRSCKGAAFAFVSEVVYAIVVFAVDVVRRGAKNWEVTYL